MTYLETFKTQFSSIFKNRGLMILLFIGPIFLTLLFGGVYVNDYLEDIPTAILDEDGSSLSRMATDYFLKSQYFDIKNYPNSREELQELIDSGKAQLGIYIPTGFESDVTTYQSSQVLLIMDGSNNVVAGNAYAKAFEIGQTISAGIEMKLIQGKGVTPQIAENMTLIYNLRDRVLFDSKMTYMNYLMICFFAIFLQQMFLSSIGSMLIRNNEYLASGNVLSRILATSNVCMVGLVPASIVSMLILKYLFHIPMIGRVWIFVLLTITFLFAITGPALVIASLTQARVKYSQISFMLSVPVFISSGIAWPVEQMPKLVEWIVRALWPMINYAKIGQEVLIKGREFHTVIPSIMGMIIYGLVWLTIGVLLYIRAFSKDGSELVA
ncbi:ABC transporter permease [Clostridium sediminicola]|uniref:ABC transporter permease n=1 Tax=Clostridium sediminicola TaxID=3114879 RepID=UPI0031F1D150